MRRIAIFGTKTVLFILLTVAAVYLLLGLAALTAGLLQYRRNTDWQERRMTWLKEEYYPSYTSGGEERFASFALSEETLRTVRLNELSFLATHNSYQPRAGLPYRLLIKAVSLIPGVPADGRLADFEMDGLSEQLEHGIRSLELDVEAWEKNGGLSFSVTHFLLDNRSCCQDFETALEELRLWSDHNPRHLPLMILIEPKTNEHPVGRLRTFDGTCAAALDEVIRRVMGDVLLTPDEVMGEYESFAAMREADGWPLLKDCLGRILFILHPCPSTGEYIAADPAVRTQAMFPCLRFDGIHEDHASFILDNDPVRAAEHAVEEYDALRLMIRTRADDYPDFSEDRYAAADNCGAQIITTDFPPRTVRKKEHMYSFDGFTVRLRSDCSAVSSCIFGGKGV